MVDMIMMCLGVVFLMFLILELLGSELYSFHQIWGKMAIICLNFFFGPITSSPRTLIACILAT